VHRELAGVRKRRRDPLADPTGAKDDVLGVWRPVRAGRVDDAVLRVQNLDEPATGVAKSKSVRTIYAVCPGKDLAALIQDRMVNANELGDGRICPGDGTAQKEKDCANLRRREANNSGY